MNKTIVNLIDQSVLANSFVESIMRCGGSKPGILRTPKNIEYVFNKSEWDGISLFTDKMLHVAPQVKSKYKVAILIEPRDLIPSMYQEILKYESFFNLILTYDKELMTILPHKTKFMCPDSSVLSDEHCKINEKTQLISMVYSNKKDLPGHQLRHIIADCLLPKMNYKKITLLGTGCDKHIATKAEGTIPFMFQLAIENAKRDNYFADKILDCFACGTIPIYWGCDNIGDFFDSRGILSFNTLDELEDILNSINEEKYYSMLDYAKINYNICLKHYLKYDDVLCEKILGEIK